MGQVLRSWLLLGMSALIIAGLVLLAWGVFHR